MPINYSRKQVNVQVLILVHYTISFHPILANLHESQSIRPLQNFHSTNRKKSCCSCSHRIVKDKAGSKRHRRDQSRRSHHKRILKILLPTIFPTAISALPFPAAVTKVISFGREVPKATMASPMSRSLRPKICAITAAESTVISAKSKEIWSDIAK